jgi:hypothetical protein
MNSTVLSTRPAKIELTSKELPVVKFQVYFPLIKLIVLILGLAPIPVPGYGSPGDTPNVPGVNTIPGLSNFNYIVGQLIPQMIPPTNTLLGNEVFFQFYVRIF